MNVRGVFSYICITPSQQGSGTIEEEGTEQMLGRTKVKLYLLTRQD